MDLSLALLIYLIVVVVLIVVLCRHGYTAASAIIVALIIGFVLLIIMAHPSEINVDSVSGSSYAIYVLILIGTVIVSMFYAFMVAIRR